MANAVVGALRIVLGADTAALDKGLKDAQGSLKGFAAAAATIAAGIGLEKLVEKAADAFTHAIKKGFEAADEFGKISQKIGIPVEELSKLGYAADLSGVKMASLEKGVGKLSQTIAQIAGGAANDATRAFEKMGISVKDSEGNIRPTTQIIEDLATKFEHTKDGAGKTALAMQIFGKSGKDLIPLLNEGKEGLARMFDEAEKLGLVISQKTVAATTHFNDDMRSLQKVTTGVALQVTAELAPAFAVLSERLKDAVINGGLVKTVSDGIINVMTQTVSVVLRLSLTFSYMAEQASLSFEVLKALASFDFSGAGKTWDKLTTSTNTYEAAVKQVDAGLQKFLADAGAKANEWAGENKKRTEEAASGVEKHKTALDNFIASQQKALAAQAADIESSGAAIGVKEKLRIENQANEIALANQIALTPQLTAQITALGMAAAASAVALKGAQLTQESLAPWQAHEQQLARIQQLYAAGAISAETYERAMRSAAVKSGTAWDVAGASIAGSFATIAGSFNKSSGAMATAAKAFAIVQATLSVYTGMAKALELPFPANLAAAATVAASGFAFLANIKSQAVPKFATGGSFAIGGAGGVDSQMVPIMATPGERVHVEQNKYGEDTGGGRTLNLNVQGETFGRETLRVIARGIESLVGDGLKINLSPA